jgi:SAM-dependent methyltransferase
MIATLSATERLCSACREHLDGPECGHCGWRVGEVAGFADFRLVGDRFLDLEAERAKAERLAKYADIRDLQGLAEAYYAMTPDVDASRRSRYLAHILGAEARGAALAALLPTRGRILEIGCGTGGLLAAARRRGLAIGGVDIAARWLVVARKRLVEATLHATMTVASAECLPWADATFDAIVADSLLEHLDDPASALAEASRVLRPGGMMLLWSPNRYWVGTDPHVGLAALGFLPRMLMPAYVRWRRGFAWPPRCLSAAEAGRLATEAGFVGVELTPPTLSESWLDGLSEQNALHVRGYQIASQSAVFRGMLRAIGPLWQLRAVKPGGSS